MDIKELRTKEGLSQAALAKRLGIATSAIGHLENGRMKVSARIAAKVKEEFGVDVAEKTATAKKTVKETAKKASAKAKTAAKKADDKVVAEKIEAKKTTRKAAAKAKETVKKAEKTVKAPVKNAKAAKLEIVIQSPMGGNITSEEIAAKLPKDAETVFVRVDQNKLWWIKGEETGSVDIW